MADVGRSGLTLTLTLTLSLTLTLTLTLTLSKRLLGRRGQVRVQDGLCLLWLHVLWPIVIMPAWPRWAGPGAGSPRTTRGRSDHLVRVKVRGRVVLIHLGSGVRVEAVTRRAVELRGVAEHHEGLVGMIVN